METVKVDDKKRVRLPDAKPGQVYAYELAGETVKLTPVKPVESENRPNRAWLEKRGKRLVAVTERPIDMAALKQALADFP